MVLGEYDSIAPATIFSPDREYRYLLTRRIGMSSDMSILFCMLNPWEPYTWRSKLCFCRAVRPPGRVEFSRPLRSARAQGC